MILAIDQGTTGTTCLVFDRAGTITGRAYSEFRQHFPRPGWVEHDAAEIWDVTRRVAGEALDDAGIEGGDLGGIGITNQRETVVAWDPDTGEPVHNALVWQDRRTAARCDELRDAGHEELVRERTGLVIDPYFSGTKIEWLRDNVDADARDAAFGTIDSWLVFKLTGRHVTDFSNASRTMLFDIRELRWDPQLCELLGVDPESLPEPVRSAEVYGHTDVFGGNVPVAGIAGDQQAALFGQACHSAGMAKNTYGTGSFVLLNTGAQAPEPGEGLLTTVAWGLEDRDRLRARGRGVHHRRRRPVAARRPRDHRERAGDRGAGGFARLQRRRLFRPRPHRARLSPLGPLRPRCHRRHHPWDGTRAPRPRGARGDRLPDGRCGARPGASRRPRRSRSCAPTAGRSPTHGSCSSRPTCSGVPVIVPEVTETTALGAAYLAGIATGMWDLDEVGEMWREAARYEPRMGEGEREELLGRWGEAVERSRGWARSEATQ